MKRNCFSSKVRRGIVRRRRLVRRRRRERPDHDEVVPGLRGGEQPARDRGRRGRRRPPPDGDRHALRLGDGRQLQRAAPRERLLRGPAARGQEGRRVLS